MGMINVSKQGPEAFIDNMPVDDMSFTNARREFHPPNQKHVDWRLAVGTVLSLLVMYIVLCLAYSIWKTVFCWGFKHIETCSNLDRIEPLIWVTVISMPIILIVCSIAARIFIQLRQSRAVYNRSNLTLDRFGDQQPADLFQRINTEQVLEFLTRRYEIANSLQRDIAPFQQYKSVNSLSLNSSNTNNPPTIDVSALDDPIKIIPSSEWITWIGRQPHIILAGATGKGKTVTAKPIIAPRIDASEQLMIIDPHADHWFGLDVIGGGENWSEIQSAIRQITMEYQIRQQARETYRRINGKSMPVGLFKRLTVVMDEGYLISLHMNTTKRGEVSTWDQFSEIFSSGARKINISLMLLTQTANCEDLGISGPLRENFTRIAVDNRAIKLMIKQDEIDAQRRQQLYDALIGMPFPATTVVDTSVMLLDRTGLDRIPDPIVTPANHYPFVRSQSVQNNGNGHVRTNELSALKSQGVTRHDARFVHGVHFTDEDWTNA